MIYYRQGKVMGAFSTCAKKGFTLMEIMVALAIISVMAGLAIPGYFKTVEVGRSNEARTNLSVIHMGQKVYFLNNGNTYWNPGGTTVAAANTALNVDMTSQNYALTNVTGNALGYTAAFTRNNNNGGAGTKTFTATYPDAGNPTGPPAIAEGGNY